MFLKKTPWKSILTSKIVYAIILTQFCSNFCTYVFLTQLPTYMREVLKFDIQSVSYTFKRFLLINTQIFRLSNLEWFSIFDPLYFILAFHHSVRNT